MRESFDAIIVGGGPAGALAGLLLARQGWRVAIVERSGSQRSKTCGHCLSPRAIPILRETDLHDAVVRISAGATGRLRLHTPGRVPLSIAINEATEGLLVDRQIFDQLIRDRAAVSGASVFLSAKWKWGAASRRGRRLEITESNQGRCSITAPLILGADGLGSGVARAVGAAPMTTGRKFGFSFDLPNASIDDPSAIDMFVTRSGYLGMVGQHGGSVHFAGLIGPQDDSLPREPIAFCRALAQRFAQSSSPGRHAGIALLRCVNRSEIRNFTAAGPMPWRPRRIAGPDFALLGDAVGYVEPFTGEGICWALQSAHALAEVASSARPGVWNSQLAEHYAELWDCRIGRAQRRCAWIAWALERRWALSFARWVAVTRPGLAHQLACKVVV